jgi:hypothetical protein
MKRSLPLRDVQLIGTFPLQITRPHLRTTPRCRPRPRPQTFQPRPQAQTDGSDQETAKSQTSRQAEREARPRQDTPSRHDRCAGDDWIGDWDLQREGVQSGRDQAGDGWILFGGVQYQLQAGEARKAGYWCYAFVTFYSIEVGESLGGGGNCGHVVGGVGAHEMKFEDRSAIAVMLAFFG